MVDTRKSNGLVWARHMVREVRNAKKIQDQLEPPDVFAAMPPVESLKALVSHMMTEQKEEVGKGLLVGEFDVSKAPFSAKAG